MDYFEHLAQRIKARWVNLTQRLKAYLKRLLFPLYLFPVKLITYTAYYLVKFLIRFIFTLIGLIFETLIFPFKSLKNFFKSIFILGIFIYLVASLFVIGDYLRTQYGYYGKFFNNFRTQGTTLVSLDVVKTEFLKGAQTVEKYNQKKEFFDQIIEACLPTTNTTFVNLYK